MARELIVVTGASAGIGRALALRLASEGVPLALLGRDEGRLATLSAELGGLGVRDAVFIRADLAEADARARAAAEILALDRPIGALVNNAGIALGHTTRSRQGNEIHFEVNTLAPFDLARRLRPRLAPGRGVVVNVSSGVISMVPGLDLAALQDPPGFRKLIGPYAQSKLALTTLTLALAGCGDGILYRSVDPGGNRTGMTLGPGMPLWLRLQVPVTFRAPRAGARRIQETLEAPRFAGKSGIHIARGRLATPPAAARDPENQAQILALCAERIGL